MNVNPTKTSALKNMKDKLSFFVKSLLGWPLTIIAFFFIGKFVLPNSSSMLIAVRSMNIFLFVLGVVAILIYFFLRVYFWQQLLRQHDIQLSLKETTWLWGSSELQRYIPGNIWTVLGRTTNFAQKNISKRIILSTFLQEAEFIVVSGLLLSLFSINFLIYGVLPGFSFKSIIVDSTIIISLCGIVLFLANQYFLKKIRLEGKIKAIALHLLPHFSFKRNLSLFFLQTAALFFFGLGTYFTISSLKLLYVHDVTTFIGFFVFSLLFGYLSFITPMGLGVREGMMTVGLMKFIPLSLAGFSAIFARVVFIFSELCFLLIAYYWHKAKQTAVDRAQNFLQSHWQEVVLGLAIVVFTLYMLAATFSRHDNFYSGRYDLGNMDQTVWNTLHGRIFQQTDANGTDIVSRLSFHADFILILLAPFYVLWQAPQMLLIIQTVTLAFGALFIYLIGKQLCNKTSAVIFACLYLINPSMNYTNLYDFHAVTLATTFLLGAFYFLKNRRYIWYLIFLILAGITKEEVWIIVAFFGIYTCFIDRKKPHSAASLLAKRIFGITITVCSLLIAYYLVERAIPQAKGGAHFALAFYSDFGSSPLQIIQTILFNPIKTLTTVFQPGQLTYLFEIFFPLGFLSLFSPLFLIFAIPDLTIDVLSNGSTFHQIYYQYTANITPFIFISAMYGYMTIKNVVARSNERTTRQSRWKKILFRFVRNNGLIYYVVCSTIISAYLFGPLPGSLHANLEMFDSPQPYGSIISNFLKDIPRKYSIAATNNLGSHLSHRQKIFTIPVGIDKADIITFLLNDPGAQPSLDAQKKMAEKMKKDKNYIEVFKQGDFVVFEKRNLYIQKEPYISPVKLFPLSIPALQHRDFVGSEIMVEKKLETTPFATQYLITYTSDGLKQYALASIPRQAVPEKGFPVLIFNHDYYPDDTYNTETSDISYINYFTQKGFLVIKPDYRGYGNSEIDNASSAPLGYSVDVMNLLSSLKAYYPADPTRMYLFGEGLGGEVTVKVLEIIGQSADKTLLSSVKGAVVWSPSIDPNQWPSDSLLRYNVQKSFGRSENDPILWQSITARDYVNDIHTPLEIDQGTSDEVVSYISSIELYNDLVSFNKNAKLRIFPYDDHQLSQYKYDALEDNATFFKKLIK